MHGIAIAILKYGYFDDNTALRRYSASCGPDHDSRMSKKKKSGLGSEARFALLQQTCMALFLNIFIVTSNSPVSIYRSICSCSHCFSGLLQGDYLRQSGPSMAAILGPGGTIYGNITCRRWSGGTSCGGGPTAA